MVSPGAIALVGLWCLGAALLLAAVGRLRAAAAARRPSAPSLFADADIGVVLAISPALLFPSPIRALVLLVVPVLAVLSRWRTGRWVPATPLTPALLLMAAMSLVSMAVSFDRHNSLGKVCGLWLGLLLFWSSVRWIRSSDRLRRATTVFLLAGGALALIGLLGTNWYGKFGVLAPIVDRLPHVIRGVPGAEDGFQPNAVAGCLVLFIPLQLALLLRPDRRPDGRRVRPLVVDAVLLLFTVGTLLLTQSRGAWIGLAVAALCTGLWLQRATRLAAFAVITVALVAFVSLGPQRIAALAISRSGPAMTQDVAGRGELWQRATQAIADFPITGLGMNNFRRLMPTMYPTLLATPDIDIAHAHNHLLQAALDLGLPGLCGYLGLWIGVWWMLADSYRRRRDGASRALTGGLAAGLIAHFVFSLADVIPLGSKVGVLFWLALALATAAARVAAADDAARV